MMEDKQRQSFLHDVLTSAGQAEMTDLKVRILDVSTSVSQLKLRVFDYMKSMYVDFDPLLKTDISFVEEANRLSQEMDALFTRIEVQTKRNLANSTGELRQLHDNLRKHAMILFITTELVNIERTMRTVEKAHDEKRYLDAANALNLFQDHFKNASEEIQQLDIYKSLKNEFFLLWDKFCQEATQSMSSYIVWNEAESGLHSSEFSLKVASEEYNEVAQIAQALYLVNELKPWMGKLQTSLMRSVLLPLIKHEGTVEVVDDEKCSTLKVEIHLESKKPKCLDTLNNLSKCFEFLHGELDITFATGETFLSLLGAAISEEFSDSLIKLCLNDTIPSSSVKQADFSDVLEKAESLHCYVTVIGFIPKENHTIYDFVRNVDVLCANKACEIHLSNAREIMKRDLQDMIEVEPQMLMGSLLVKTEDSTCNISGNKLGMNSYIPSNGEKQELNPNLFQFPKCCVSKSTLEILELVRSILNEATKNTEQGGFSLFNTARSVIELYKAIVPCYHGKFLNTIPQQVALFHNNCMYLAHCLLTLGFEVETHLRAVLKSSTVVTYVDLVYSLRSLGTSTYLKHMQFQRKQILDIIKESGLASLGENSDLSSKTEKAFQQCLRQLELLMQVWQNVLPSNVYNKSIGILVNSFIEELVVRVSSVEDIPANAATQLTSLFEMVSIRIPSLFLNEREVVLHVKKWLKFQELIHVLGATLRDIEERWADGKGLLAHEFTVDQVKQLIRALFQNTKRRAEVLAKIR